MTAEQAIAAAERLARERGYSWEGRVKATRGRRWWLWGRPVWYVVSNYDNRGCNVYVDLDDESGEILRAGFAPR